MNEALFQLGQFELAHAGESEFKIECDALTDEDWETIAHLIDYWYDFHIVHGIPTGGNKLEELLEPKTEPMEDVDRPRLLIVDDVLTTGQSMQKALEQFNEQIVEEDWTYRGVVLFARNEPPEWVDAIFQMW